ncbi:helix-turn-helix domain-containing protein [Undibacterium sp. GrIS 1.2]|uniref:helix-turn-helix domain-containing protein n=1 Tax=Undibacterium sp. GrIS 1.2 TaxID=3143933 RepID=UPI00339B2796
MRTLDLEEAAAFLKMHPEEVRRRAKLGYLPGAKPGKSWVFLENDLAEYVRSHYAYPRQALQVTPTKEKEQCHLLNAVIRGGSTLPRRQESELDALLQQKVRLRRKNCTTS